MNPDIYKQQPPALPPHHVSKSMKIIMLIFGLVLVATLGWLVWDSNHTPDDTDNTAPKVTTSTTEKALDTTTADANAVACGDKAYAFDLTFGAMWKGYKIKELKTDDAVITCYINMPTTDKDTVWTTAQTTNLAGYASVFAVVVYTPAQWQTAQELNPPTKLGSNDSYVWAYASAQALPDDLQTAKIADDVKNVVATFKVSP